MTAVDCHFHVIGPIDRYPLLPGRSYTPPEAPLAAWSAEVEALGIPRGVVVQPSVYGTDNAALLAALADGGDRIVGVGAVNAEVQDGELDALVAAGVRGLRFAYFEPGDPRLRAGLVPLAELGRLAPRMRERSLHADLFTDTRLLAGLAVQLRAAQVPIVLDHMGRTPATVALPHAGIGPLQVLMDEGHCWVKLSGLANVSELAPGYDDARHMHEWLTTRFPERLVWGSDWPHVRPSGAAPSTKDLFQLLLDWTPSQEIRDRVLSQNPNRLYGFS